MTESEPDSDYVRLTKHMKRQILFLVLGAAAMGLAQTSSSTNALDVVDLGNVVVEGTALSRYRPEKVGGATFTDVPPEELPTVVETLTEDFIREHNPTDLHDLMRYVPGIETGGKSLLIRQPGTFAIRGMGGSEPTFDGVMPIGRGAGLFIDPFLLDRVEIVKGPIGALGGGAGAFSRRGARLRRRHALPLRRRSRRKGRV